MFSIVTNNFPSDTYKDGKPDKTNSAQLNWLKGKLSQQSSNGWKIVFGHMPLVSHGLHGFEDADEIGEFKDAILDTLCANKVDFYLSGHDHHLEINKFECPSTNGAQKHVLVSVISGAAGIPDRIYPETVSKNDYNLLWANGAYYEKGVPLAKTEEINGFVHVELTENSTARISLRVVNKLSKPLSNGEFLLRKGREIVRVE